MPPQSHSSASTLTISTLVSSSVYVVGGMSVAQQQLAPNGPKRAVNSTAGSPDPGTAAVANNSPFDVHAGANLATLALRGGLSRASKGGAIARNAFLKLCGQLWLGRCLWR